MNKEHLHPEGRPYTKEEFVEKIKTDESFAKRFGELGPVYGKQWRNWRGLDRSEMRMSTYRIDQIANLISELKTNPDSRRLMVNAWNVGELDQMVLPPCHYGFQVYTRELSMEERYNWYIQKYNKNLSRSGNQFDMDDILNSNNIPTRAISLMWNQRSVDIFLGLPFNIASYGLLLEIIAKEVNMIPEELIGNLGDVHLYSNHKEQSVEQIGREPFELPTLEIHSSKIDDIAHHEIADFEIKNYQSHPSIKAPLSN